MPNTTKNWLTTEVYLEITAGPFAGQKKQAREGLRIGRAQGEWIIKDPTISSLHAEIKRHARGMLILADLGSKHQINYRGTPVQKVALLPGVEFKLGNTPFRVQEGFVEQPLVTDKNQPFSSTADELYQAQLLAKDMWRDQIITKVTRYLNLKGPRKDQPTFKVFPQPIELEWVQGLELGRREILGYGPRFFGDINQEFILFEKNSPPVAWVIAPAPESSQGICLIQTPHPSLILINEKSQKEYLLTETTRIFWGSSIIEVRPTSFAE